MLLLALLVDEGVGVVPPFELPAVAFDVVEALLEFVGGGLSENGVYPVEWENECEERDSGVGRLYSDVLLSRSGCSLD